VSVQYAAGFVPEEDRQRLPASQRLLYRWTPRIPMPRKLLHYRF